MDEVYSEPLDVCLDVFRSSSDGNAAVVRVNFNPTTSIDEADHELDMGVDELLQLHPVPNERLEVELVAGYRSGGRKESVGEHVGNRIETELDLQPDLWPDALLLGRFFGGEPRALQICPCKL